MVFGADHYAAAATAAATAAVCGRRTFGHHYLLIIQTLGERVECIMHGVRQRPTSVERALVNL